MLRRRVSASPAHHSIAAAPSSPSPSGRHHRLRIAAAAAGTDGRRRTGGAGTTTTTAQHQQPRTDAAGEIEPRLQTTAWQQRQQAAQQHQRGGSKQRARPGYQSQPHQQPQQRRAPPPREHNGHSSSRFAAESTYQAVLQRLLPLQPPPPRPAAEEQRDGEGASSTADAGEQQQAAPPLQLPAADVVSLVTQLSAIARQRNGTSSSSSAAAAAPPVANAFLEDQALQQILPLAYWQLEQCSQQQAQMTQQQQQRRRQQGDATPMQPRDVLRCISALAGLKYSDDARLAQLLEPSAAAAGTQQAMPPVPGALGSSTSTARTALLGLRVDQLAALASNLARAGMRPSNAWLLAFMQVAQLKLASANIPQLALLLSGLIRLGVKPTTAWLDDMQDRAVQCLLEQAVRLQVAADQQQQQQGNGGSSGSTQAGSWRPHRQQQQQQQRLGTAGRSKQRTGSWQLRDVALLLSALAEARHAVKPQLTAALWGATAASLAAADAAALTELLVALGDLQLVPPAAWIQRYYAATSAGARRAADYRPWQIAASVAALGRLAVAGLPCCSSAPAQQQQQQQQQDGVQDCTAWVAWMLRTAGPYLQPGSGQHSFAPRDLVALLSGVAALQLQDSPARCERILAALQGVLPRLNTAGLADAFEAVAALQRQHQQGRAQLVLPDGLWEALLTEVAVKLPVFPADHLARVLQCVAACPGLQPTPLWLQAVAAQLSSKLTLLQPPMLVAVLAALVQLGSAPEPQWTAAAVSALDSHLAELPAGQLRQLLALLVTLNVTPSPAWLDRAQWAEQQQEGGSRDDESCTALLQQLRQGSAPADGEGDSSAQAAAVSRLKRET